MREIRLGDYVRCVMEYEGDKWVRVDEIHEDVSEVSGLTSGPGFSGEVISCMDGGFATPVHDEEMVFPCDSIVEVRKMDWDEHSHRMWEKGYGISRGGYRY
jgi:hypothetical protein